jgi:hypothetical protein
MVKQCLSALAASLLWTAPLAAAPAEVPIEAPGPSGPLRGTLLPGDAKSPPVLIIPGSGPTDRDGNNPLGVKLDLTSCLPKRWLRGASARCGSTSAACSEAPAPVADGNAVTVPDYAADVRNWVAAIRKRWAAAACGCSDIAKAGWLRSRRRTYPMFADLFSSRRQGARLGDTLRDQLRANPANAPLLDQALSAITRLEAGERVDATTLHPALMSLFAPQVQGFLISLFSYDPAALLAKNSKPVLVVQGGRDLQVGEADARRLAAARPGVELLIVPTMNHVLKSIPSEDRAANLGSYGDPAQPIAAELVDAVARFVSKPR